MQICCGRSVLPSKKNYTILSVAVLNYMQALGGKTAIVNNSPLAAPQTPIPEIVYPKPSTCSAQSYRETSSGLSESQSVNRKGKNPEAYTPGNLRPLRRRWIRDHLHRGLLQSLRLERPEIHTPSLSRLGPCQLPWPRALSFNWSSCAECTLQV